MFALTCYERVRRMDRILLLLDLSSNHHFLHLQFDFRSLFRKQWNHLKVWRTARSWIMPVHIMGQAKLFLFDCKGRYPQPSHMTPLSSRLDHFRTNNTRHLDAIFRTVHSHLMPYVWAHLTKALRRFKRNNKDNKNLHVYFHNFYCVTLDIYIKHVSILRHPSCIRWSYWQISIFQVTILRVCFFSEMTIARVHNWGNKEQKQDNTSCPKMDL